MIVDHLSRAPHYMALNPGIAAALRALQDGEITTRPLGRYDLDGDRLYAMVQTYETKAWADGFMESHRRYIDVQYMIRGDEKMGYLPTDGLVPSTPYDAARDAAFYPGIGDPVAVKAGMFTIFFPTDAHAPGLGITSAGGDTILKVVFKVLIEG